MNRLVWPLVAGAGLLVGVAALHSAGQPSADLAPAARLVVQLPASVLWIAGTSGALAVLLFFALALLRDGRRREEDGEAERESPIARLPAWLRPIVGVLALLPYVLLAYVLWTGGVPELLTRLVDQIARLTAFADGSGAADGDRPVVSSPVFTGAIATLVLLAGLGSLGLLLCLLFAERLARWWTDTGAADERDAVVEAVDESLDDLRLEIDPRLAIIACYRNFELALARSRVPRAPWQTPLEFMREALRRLPLPAAPVQALTGLFELSRFSAEPLGQADRDAALAALLDIQASLAPRDSGVSAR